ncbi:universal stress protein UspE [Glaciecola sp. MH2013]|uniref:universal stress protein UspE n=1 Tax=Glaciecola sp. MH2013 TaxID=2785524 RepID=UPI00189EB9A8|nr:universal stress protein UspE [Glaciecola sp. MH2013]MBF7072834.1 universal stress protein UspE [Glaciecola sp. MH2013]
MFTCNTILAVLDPTSDVQIALNRAYFIAQKTKASIIALSCIYDKSFEMAAVLSSDERFNMKQGMLNHAKMKNDGLYHDKYPGVDIKYVYKWHKKLHEAVIESSIENACDLVIKSTKKHGFLSKSIFTPNDWHILRNSEVNVMLVKDHDWPNKAKVLASVGVSAKDETHMSLSDKVVATASEVSLSTNANLHLANSYAGAPVHIAVEVPNFSPDVYNESVLQRHKTKLKEYATQYSLDDSFVHVEEGLPEDIVPQLCKDLDIDLLVIGSVGRRGMSAAILGNTAEMIIDSVECDTLVIKP